MPDQRFSLEEISQAWAQDEFESWFEPKVDLATGTVRGMAAVPRWRHPAQGVIGPELFMPSIDARGLSDDLVWLMLKKSAAQCRSWNDQGFPIVVSVNLALRSLTDANLAVRVQEICEREALEPARMVLTVPEQLLNTGVAKTLENLARLRLLGFGLGIEEFGSDRMAVEDLALVNFTELKIVSSYVAGADSDETVRAGLAIELASRLKLRTVAAGICSKDEWDLLHEWGCVLGQGPFISRPLQADAVPAWSAAQTRASGCVHCGFALMTAGFPPKALRVVAADDHDLVRFGLQSVLARIEGVEIVGEARDGVELVRIVDQVLPDLVMTDISMPLMDGIQPKSSMRSPACVPAAATSVRRSPGSCCSRRHRRSKMS